MWAGKLGLLGGLRCTLRFFDKAAKRFLTALSVLCKMTREGENGHMIGAFQSADDATASSHSLPSANYSGNFCPFVAMLSMSLEQFLVLLQSSKHGHFPLTHVWSECLIAADCKFWSCFLD